MLNKSRHLIGRNWSRDFSHARLTKTSTDVNIFQIPGYSFVHICRADKNGGGACLYIKDDLEFKFRFDLSGSNSGYVIVFVEITNLSKKIIVGCVYRAPSYDSISFVENLEHQLQILSRETRKYI